MGKNLENVLIKKKISLLYFHYIDLFFFAFFFFFERNVDIASLKTYII